MLILSLLVLPLLFVSPELAPPVLVAAGVVVTAVCCGSTLVPVVASAAPGVMATTAAIYCQLQHNIIKAIQSTFSAKFLMS